MKASKANELIKQGFKIKVYLGADKKHTKRTLKAYLYSNDTNVVHPVYYNHVKSHLNANQLQFIETYNAVKNYSFRQDVELNMKYKSNSETRQDIAKRVMRKAIKHLEYLEQD